MTLQDFPGCLEAFIGLCRRHLDVDHDRVRIVELDLTQQGDTVRRGCHDIAASIAEQPGEALADEQGVVCDHNPHRASMSC
jgi:hypothetical protein